MRTVKTFTLDEIEDALHNTDIQWDEDFTEVVRTDYSGRSMYGESCFGLVLRNDDAFGDIYALVRALVDKGVLEDDYEDVEMVRAMREDSMGLGTIYYFPGYQVHHVKCVECGKDLENEEDEAKISGTCWRCHLGLTGSEEE